MLQIQNLTVVYETLPVIQDLSLTFPAGKICGLIGANGAGKSTLLKVAAGIIREHAGTVTLFGKNISENRYWLKTQLGYAPEDVELLSYLSGMEFLQMISGIRQLESGEAEIKQLITMLGLNKAAGQLIVNYSHGMRQKLSLAAALLGSPKLLLLDEALNGLDTMALLRLKAHLQELAAAGHLVVIASHILPLVREWCDPLFIMHKGEILRRISRDEIEIMEHEQKVSLEEYFIKLVNQ